MDTECITLTHVSHDRFREIPENEWATRVIPAETSINGPSRSRASDVERLAFRLDYAMSSLRNCIEVDPRRQGGVPVLRGTRFTLSQLLAEVAENQRLSEIADDLDLDLSLLGEILRGLSICLDRPAAS